MDLLLKLLYMVKILVQLIDPKKFVIAELDAVLVQIGYRK